MSGAGKRPGAAGQLLAGKDAGASAGRFPNAPSALRGHLILAAVLHLGQSGREAQEGESVARLVTAARRCRGTNIAASARSRQHLSFVRRVLEPGRAALRDHGERTPANRNDRLGAFLHVVACLELRLKRTALTRLLTDEEE